MNHSGFRSLLMLLALSVSVTEAHAQRVAPYAGKRDSSFWNSGIERVRATVAAQIERELLAQRAAWKAEETKEHKGWEGVRFIDGVLPPDKWNDLPSIRLVHVSCNWLGYGMPRDLPPPYPNPGQIRSVVSQPRKLCAGWIPAKALQGRSHEATGQTPEPAELRPFSQGLIALLDSAHGAFPHDDWFLRQLVRVLTENREVKRAHELATACDELSAWCNLIRGYTTSLLGHATLATRSFRRALAQLSPEHRCEWTNVPALMMEYQFTQDPAWCDRHLGKSLTAWWLGVPFYSDTVDWRRLEHHVRGVRNAMAMDLLLDAHYNLQLIKGADMIVAKRFRYGWPSHMVFSTERWENEVMSKRMLQSAAAPPYPAPEYSTDRVSTLPSPRAMLAPLSATDDDFLLSPPPGVSVYAWWPPEHFKHPGGTIERVAHQQRAFLRRDSTTMFVIASVLRGGRIDNVGTAPVHTALVFTPNADSVAILARQTTTRGDTIVMHSEITSPGIVSFEYLVNAHGLAGGRTRFGIDTLPTLTALLPGTCAISEPLLTRANALAGNGTTDALTGLLGSLVLDKPDKLGLVWESYGFAATDTTRIAVQIVSVAEISRLRRAGMALGIMDDPTTSVTISWEEPRAPAARTVLATKVPTIARQLTVNIDRLRVGEYVLAISMEKNGCAPVRSERVFVVTR